MKKKIAAILLFVIALAACKKANEFVTSVGDKIIDGYWSDINGLVLEFKDNEAKVIEYGSSGLGTNSSIFNKKNDIYIRNIVRVSPTSWTGDIAVGVYDNGVWTGINYEPTTITVSTSSNNKETIALSISDFGPKSLDKKPSTYTPPVEPITCDTVTRTHQDQTNICNLINQNSLSTYTNIEVKSKYVKPFMSNIGCNYEFSTTTATNPYGTVFPFDFKITFGERPIPNKTYRVIENDFATLLKLDDDEVAISYSVQYSSEASRPATVKVYAADGNKLRMVSDTIQLQAYFDLKTIFDITGY